MTSKIETNSENKKPIQQQLKHQTDSSAIEIDSPMFIKFKYACESESTSCHTWIESISQ